jgi:hypothetical protein
LTFASAKRINGRLAADFRITEEGILLEESFDLAQSTPFLGILRRAEFRARSDSRQVAFREHIPEDKAGTCPNGSVMQVKRGQLPSYTLRVVFHDHLL